jgi:hypothetical protein
VVESGVLADDDHGDVGVDRPRAGPMHVERPMHVAGRPGRPLSSHGGHDPLSFGPAHDRGEEVAADGAASRRARRDQRVARGPIALADACRHPHDDAHDATAALLDPV